jgi:plastocyanin
VEVHITGTSFNPSVITITPGTTVRWINDTGDFHTVTPENTGQPNLWQRTVTAGQGTVVEKTFTTGGGQLYRYRCEPHSSSFTSGMTGSITVQ